MNAIAGTHRTYSLLADGTLRIKIDIEPRHVAQFHAMFPGCDLPVALAPLVYGIPEASEPEPIPEAQLEVEKPKGGNLARLAGTLCKNPAFQEMLNASDDESAAQIVREVCGIESRSELDHDDAAAEIFHERFRKPFLEMDVR